MDVSGLKMAIRKSFVQGYTKADGTFVQGYERGGSPQAGLKPAGSQWSDWSDPSEVDAVRWDGTETSHSLADEGSSFVVGGQQFNTHMIPDKISKPHINTWASKGVEGDGWEFSFETNGETSLTGKGRAYEVMRQAAIHLASGMKKHSPAYVYFSADAAEPSRVKLYKFMAKRSALLFPGYVGVEVSDPSRNNIEGSGKASPSRSFKTFAIVREDAVESYTKAMEKMGGGVERLDSRDVKSLGLSEGFFYDFTGYLMKSRVAGYTKKDGTVVQGYDTSRTKGADEVPAARQPSPEDIAASRRHSNQEIDKVSQQAAQEADQAGDVSIESADKAYDDALMGGDKKSIRETRQSYIRALMADSGNATPEQAQLLSELNKLDYLQMGTRSVAFKEWFGDWESGDGSKVVDKNGRPQKNREFSAAVGEDGEPVVVYHGTTHEFEQFSEGRGNIENSFGIGHYFTTDSGDVDRNYAGEGPDLKNRVEHRYEQISYGVTGVCDAVESELSGLGIDVTDGIDESESDDVYNLVDSLSHGEMPSSAVDLVVEEILDQLRSGVEPSDVALYGEDLAKETARKELVGGTARTIEAYLKSNNPVVLDGRKGTYFEIEYSYDQEVMDEYNERIAKAYIDSVVENGGSIEIAAKIAKEIQSKSTNPMDFSERMDWDLERVALSFGANEEPYTGVVGGSSGFPIDDIGQEWDDIKYESEEIGGDAARLMDAVDRVAYQYDWEMGSAEEFKQSLSEHFADWEGISANQFAELIAEKEMMVTDYDHESAGSSMNGQFVQDVFREMGFDAIQDKMPALRFRNMGIGADEHHWIVFEPQQVKSADNDGSFDKTDPRYRKSLSDSLKPRVVDGSRKSRVADYTRADGTRVRGYDRSGAAATESMAVENPAPDRFADERWNAYSAAITEALVERDYGKVDEVEAVYRDIADYVEEASDDMSLPRHLDTFQRHRWIAMASSKIDNAMETPEGVSLEAWEAIADNPTKHFVDVANKVGTDFARMRLRMAASALKRGGMSDFSKEVGKFLGSAESEEQRLEYGRMLFGDEFNKTVFLDRDGNYNPSESPTSFSELSKEFARTYEMRKQAQLIIDGGGLRTYLDDQSEAYKGCILNNDLSTESSGRAEFLDSVENELTLNIQNQYSPESLSKEVRELVDRAMTNTYVRTMSLPRVKDELIQSYDENAVTVGEGIGFVEGGAMRISYVSNKLLGEIMESSATDEKKIKLLLSAANRFRCHVEISGSGSFDEAPYTEAIERIVSSNAATFREGMEKIRNIADPREKLYSARELMAENGNSLSGSWFAAEVGDIKKQIRDKEKAKKLEEARERARVMAEEAESSSSTKSGRWDNWKDPKELEEVQWNGRGGSYYSSFSVETDSGTRTFQANVSENQYGSMDMHTFSFSDDSGGYELSGRGNAMQVMRKAVVTLGAFVREKAPSVVYFTAASDEKSRVKLYKFFATRASMIFPGYVGVEITGSSTGEYAIVHKDELHRTLDASKELFGGSRQIKILKNERQRRSFDPDEMFFQELLESLIDIPADDDDSIKRKDFDKKSRFVKGYTKEDGTVVAGHYRKGDPRHDDKPSKTLVKKPETAKRTFADYGSNSEVIEKAVSLLGEMVTEENGDYHFAANPKVKKASFPKYDMQPLSIRRSIDRSELDAKHAIQRLLSQLDRRTEDQDSLERDVRILKGFVRVQSQWQHVVNNPLDLKKISKEVGNPDLDPANIEGKFGSIVALEQKMEEMKPSYEAVQDEEMSRIRKVLNDPAFADDHDAMIAEMQSIKDEYSKTVHPYEAARDKFYEAFSGFETIFEVEKHKRAIVESESIGYHQHVNSRMNVLEDGFSGEDQSALDDIIGTLSSYMSRDAWGMVDAKFIAIDGRSKYVPPSRGLKGVSCVDSTISRDYLEKVSAHEFGHHLEFDNPAAMFRANEFLDARIEKSGSEDVPMSNFGDWYSDGEIGNIDGFGSAHYSNDQGERDRMAAYNGKRYSDGATEIISHGCELMLGSRGFAQSDYEYFMFMVGILNGQLLQKKE